MTSPSPLAQALIVIPTYNERENIGTLIDGIFAQGDRSLLPERPSGCCAQKGPVPFTLHVLVVDDHSPDGTAEVVSERQKRYGPDRLQLLERREGKAGRGSACLAGFAIARERGYSAAIEMDADLSHDPKDIPRFLEALHSADVVIGSKYLSGSRIIGWEWYRRLLSWGANAYARVVLSLPIRDYTNGYRCYGPRALALLPEFTFEGTGFTVIPQVSYALHQRGMRLREIPITFTNRRRGTSNMSFREMREGFLAILHIRSHDLALHTAQIAKFAATGFMNAFIDFGILVFCIEVLGWPLLLSNVLSTGIAITNAFAMNKRWTFRNPSVGSRHTFSQYTKFLLVYGSCFLLVQVALWFFAVYLGFWYIPVKILIIPAAAAWNYLWMHYAVFHGRGTPGSTPAGPSPLA